MSIYSDNDPILDASPHYQIIAGLNFTITPADRQATSANLVENEKMLMDEGFPSDDYTIYLELHRPKTESERDFLENTVITFEGMMKRKFDADGKSYQQAPKVSLVFVGASTEPEEVYKSRLTEIRHLLVDYQEQGKGLRYWIGGKERPDQWAKDFVDRGIVNKSEI